MRIQFKINYRVKLKRKLKDFLERYQTEIGYRIQELKIERYWGNDEQLQADFFIEIDPMEKEKMIYEILMLANKLWSTRYANWTINGPYENESLIFECFLNNDNEDQPMKWAHLELENE